MTNLEYYKDVINEMIKNDSSADISSSIGNAFNLFSFRHIENYPRRPDKFIDWLLEEHKEPIKLKQWEYDTIKYHGKLSKFNGIYFLMAMRNKGYFKGVTDTSMKIEDILKNCEVIE